MQIVDAALGRRFALKIEQMPEVVQQTRDDQLRRRARVFRERGRLQRVLKLGDRFAAI